MASVMEFARQLRGIFARQSTLSRMFTFLLVIGISGALLYASRGGAGGAYAPLYPNLPPDDAAAVVSHLKTANVAYKLANDGATILVPKKMIPELRMQVAQLNLPMGGGVGFEWFDKPPIGMTDRVQEINYVRALQGELARSIATLTSVERARVILALKDRTSFIQTEENKPSASVVLELTRGASLTTRNIEGILNLVSRSVEGLEPERVALIDARTGETLNKAAHSLDEAVTDQNVAFRSRYEQDLERDIESMLEHWAGKGEVVARVNADFDFRQTKTTTTSYNDDAKALESVTMRAENVAGVSAAAAGPVGSASAMPGLDAKSIAATAPTTPGSNGSITKEEKYKVTQVDTTTIEPTASLKALTVAVMVNEKEEETKDESPGEKKTVRVPRTPKELAAFETLVKKTVGFTDDRADMITVSVECVPFAKTGETVEDKALDVLERQDMIRHFVTWGVYALLGILAMLFVARPIMQALLSASAPVARMRPALAGGPEGIAGALPGPGLGAALGNEYAPALPSGADPRQLLDRAETAAANKQIEELLKTDPARAAALIRRWLEES